MDRLAAGLVAAARLASPAAAATRTVDFAVTDGTATIASGSFSFADTLTGRLGYSDLDSFRLDSAGENFTLAEVLPLTNFQYFAYDVASNTLLGGVVTGTLNGSPIDFLAVLGAIDLTLTDGFFFSPLPGAAGLYAASTPGEPNQIFVRTAVTLTVRDVTEVPVPAAALLFGAGLLGLAFARRRG
jgi:hypothetical protein